MLTFPTFEEARALLMERTAAVDCERLPLSDCGGRVLAQDLCAEADIPPFDRSPYDGYAFRGEDTLGASRETPVTLRILEEIPAGGVPHYTVTEGTAVKILTGAPIPPGADTVCKYEETDYSDDAVTLYAPCKRGDNIVYAGEDVKKGTVLAPAGSVIDAGLAGTLAAQGVTEPSVYRHPHVALISTGSELLDIGDELAEGKIRNSNRYMLEAALVQNGLEPVSYGTVGDDVNAIARLFAEAAASCDAVISTGGVSVGDYDLSPAAMELAGAETLIRGVGIKPGKSCAFAALNGKVLYGLSGNPAAALTDFYAIALPALKKLAGRRDCLPRELTLRLKSGFRKKSPYTRLLRGRLDLSDGMPAIELPGDQSNSVLSSTIGSDVMAIIPPEVGPMAEGETLKGFLL